ncbi:MAG: hypothetical protein ABII00_05250 [Elusimicrobiota bacterium]
MKMISILIVSMMTANAAWAGSSRLLGSTVFLFAGAAQVREAAADVPVFDGAPHDRVESVHLLPRCGDSSLVGRAENQDEYRQALARWTSILSAAGIKVGKPELREDIALYIIPYETGNGTIIREFMAEPKQFPPKDEQALRANRDMVVGKMGEAGLRILASYIVDVDSLLPTYSIYYLTTAEKMQESETQVRVLRPGGDIHFDVLEDAGVAIIQKPETWMMVYIGREIGMVTRYAGTMERAQERLAERTEFLVSRGKGMIGSKVSELSGGAAGESLYAVTLYFYQ